ncbi:MAG: hypothetical protein NVSMB68_03420 [Thermoanaerobaculia bacterium]
MAKVLVRNLEERVVNRLKQRARQKNRSLQTELQMILERAAVADVSAFRSLTTRVRKKLSTRKHSDSAASIRSDRRR